MAYTINQFPSGSKTNASVAKVVPPPPSRNTTGTGVLHLSWGDATAQFESEGWELVGASLDPEDASKFEIAMGNGAIVNTGENAAPLVTKGTFGGVHTRLDFMLTEAGTGTLAIGDVAVVTLSTDPGRNGAIGELLPVAEAKIEPGQWVTVETWTQIASAEAPAVVDKIVLNGVTVQEGLEVSGTSGERGPLSIAASGGQIALRDIRAEPLDAADNGPDQDGWTTFDPGAAWDDWVSVGDAEFELEGSVIRASGAKGYLWLPIDDFQGGTLRLRARVNSNGAGAVVLGAAEGEGGVVAGAAVRLNTSFPGGELTGSITTPDIEAAVATELVSTDTWMDLDITVLGGETGSTIEVRISGVLVNRLTTKAPLSGQGIALRVDHQGTVIEIDRLRLKR